MKKFLPAAVALFFTLHSFSQSCTKLFFSEYIEGSSNNKALEIYNPTAGTVDLTGYRVLLFSNGATSPTNTINLSGTVAASGVFVIVNASANDSLKAYSDTLSNVTNFNGDDAVVLLNGTDTLDIIGVVGFDPGTSWAVDSGSTVDHTLIRKAAVQQGTTNWSFGATQWNILPRDTFRLGSHTMDPCGAVTDTIVAFSAAAGAVNENAGTYNISVSLNAPSATDTFTVDVELAGGTGGTADIGGYTTQTVTFIPGTVAVSVPVTITDDTIVEPAETFIFRLINASGSLLIGTDSLFTLTINANDVPVIIDTVTLAQITSLDTTFRPDSLGKVVYTTGTVYGINYRATGLQFTIHDATDGIGVFSSPNTFGYTVTEGDSVAIIGTVEFFSGITQLGSLDTIYKIGTGSLLSPVITPDLDESTESELIRLNNVHLVTPSQWDTAGNAAGFSCSVTDGVGTWTLRIDEQTDIFKTNVAAPVGNFHVIGIGGQFDNSSPYNSGYQILPRYQQDIILINGLQTIGQNILSVYPNPNNGSFIIASQQNYSGAELNLFDISGGLVYSTVINQSNTAIDATRLGQGVYILQLKNGEQIQHGKINVVR